VVHEEVFATTLGGVFVFVLPLYPICAVFKQARVLELIFMQAPKLTASELEAHLARDFPQGTIGKGKPYQIEHVAMREAVLRYHADDASLRPGGTVAGAILMTLADYTVYVAILASIGWVPLAVTTNLTMNFLKKPSPGDLLATCKLIKLGKRLAIGEVAIRSEGEEELVAHCVSTYSIPSSS
jgi:uncharacterized protein (TIGR00369 family)